MTEPYISILLPCRNEEEYIQDTLDMILSQDFPEGGVEILVIDGESEDRTREWVEDFSERDERVRLLRNPGLIAPSALNIGVQEARGSFIVRMDAHSSYPRYYVRSLVEQAEESGADNVGGTWDIRPGGNGIWARSIAAVTDHRLGVGNVAYRFVSGEPVEVDTVPYGCFRRTLFEEMGGFDTEVVCNEDDEFNGRLLERGGRILLIPNVVIGYYGRPDLKGMGRQYFRYAYYKPIVNKKLRRPTTLRQFAPPLFVLVLLGLLTGSLFLPQLLWVFLGAGLLYLLLSWKVAYDHREKVGAWGILTVPIALLILHLSYGIGYWGGLIRWRLIGYR